MKRVNPKRTLILAIILLVFGYATITQTGQPMPVFQNDGNAFIGSVSILLAGVMIGLALSVYRGDQKGKTNGKR